MSEWLTGLVRTGLVFVVIVTIGGFLVWWLVTRTLSATARLGRSAVTALSSGGVSLFWPEANNLQEAQNTSPARTRRRVVLDALATGGVSIFTEPGPRTDGSGFEENHPEPD
jgi:DNA-binding transcriptional regulator of glucitol operon